MAELSAHDQPLLSNGAVDEHGYAKRRMPFWPCLGKWVLKTLMWAVFIAWVAVIFLYPNDSVNVLYSKFNQATEGSIFGITGSIFLLFSAPILIIAFLAYAHVAAFPGDNYEIKTKKPPRLRLWTFPVLVDGPFGVVSAAEFIGILLFCAYITWAIYCYALQTGSLISKFSLPSNLKRYLLLEICGLRLGSIGLFCLAFLFLPIARGSILLRLIDIPFEHATKYHVWLGHLTMAVFTLHGLCYVISWAQQGCLLRELLEWNNIGVANLAGVISLLAGLLMWVTSLQPVRKKYFELFFYTHQLYVVFIIFLALHVGDFIFSIAAGGIFIFILDRFLRFCQSRTTVNVISAACLPCGTVELVLSKPADLRYNALSFIFLQVRELSWLQWHPFSVSSSPLDGKNHISILIKVLGKWTEKLRDVISNVAEKPQNDFFSQPDKITASVEGPYGHELAYHLMYENLILVAGGIGISPFLAILSDVLHRIEERRPCLPKNILVVWAVKKSKELSLLSVVNAKSICPSLSDKLHLEIQAYVTQESEPLLEEGKDYKNSSSFTMTNGSSISSLVGTSDNTWAGIYFAISTVGFFILLGLAEVFYIRPYGISSWWFRGLLFTICMIASVVIFGGLIVFLWHLRQQRNSSYNICAVNNEKAEPVLYNDPIINSDTSKLTLMSSMTTQYGCRPDFQAIFDYFSDRVGHVDVGVIVCGPPGLQSSVAHVCRSKNVRGGWNLPIFHFNSHSFDL